MKHVIRTISILAAVAFAACFGSGPVPPAPSDATSLFAVPESTESCTGFYIGDVAYGSDTGFAIVVPYTLQNNGNNNNNCDNGGNPPPDPLTVYQFDLAGVTPMSMIGTAGTGTNGIDGAARIAVTNGSANWAYPNSSIESFTLGPSGATVGSGMNGGNLYPVGMVANATTFYVGLSPTGSAVNPGSPNFPCSNNNGGCNNNNNNNGQGIIYSIDSNPQANMALPVAPQFACSTVERCLAINDTSLFYFESAQNGNQIATQISELPFGSNTPTQVGTIQQGSFASQPVGIAATPSTVAWAVATTGTGAGCAIMASDLTSMPPTTRMLLTTDRFACAGLAIDGTENAAYFTIVAVTQDDDNGGQDLMTGIGLGRIDLANNDDFTSIALGILGNTSGPRRIDAMGDNVYVVDPEIIASIPKSAFTGAHDFVPSGP